MREWTNTAPACPGQGVAFRSGASAHWESFSTKPRQVRGTILMTKSAL